MVENGTFENAPKYIHCEEKGEDNLLSDLLREPQLLQAGPCQ